MEVSVNTDRCSLREANRVNLQLVYLDYVAAVNIR